MSSDTPIVRDSHTSVFSGTEERFCFLDVRKTRNRQPVRMDPLPTWAQDVQKRQAAVWEMCEAAGEALELATRMLHNIVEEQRETTLASVEEARAFWSTQLAWGREELEATRAIELQHRGRTCALVGCMERFLPVRIRPDYCSECCEMQGEVEYESEEDPGPTDDQLIEEAMENFKMR